MRLSKVKIKNFRCLKSVELDISPITIIYGENGSGKSSILEAIQLLKQSIGNNRLITDGIINFGSYKDIVMNGDEDQWVTIGVGISFENDEFQNHLLSSTDESLDYFYNILKMDFPITYVEYEASFRRKNRVWELSQVLKLNEVRLIEVRHERINGVQNKVVIPNINAIPNLSEYILHENIGYFSFQRIAPKQQRIREAYGRLGRDLNRIFHNVLNNYFLISPARASMPFEAQTPTDPKWVGYKGEALAGLLSKIWGKVDHYQKRKKISDWAERFGLTELWAGFHGGKKLGVTFRDPLTQAPVNLNWAGHGSKQVLVLITQMFWGDKGEIVAMEEPEISLHLQLQMELARLFAEVVKEGKQVIITSHSAQFLTAFRSLFKNQTLTTKDLAVQHLKKTKEGATNKKLKVTKQGIVKPFIPSIAEAEKKLVSEAY